MFLVGVDDEQDVGQPAHLLDAAERALELVALAGETQELLLGQPEVFLVLAELLLQLLQAAHGDGNRLPVGHHAAEPTMIDVMLAAALGRLGDLLGRLALGADEEHAPAAGDRVPDGGERPVKQRHGLLQIDDVDLVALAENEGRHLRVPAPGAVSEMDPRFQQLAHGKGR